MAEQIGERLIEGYIDRFQPLNNVETPSVEAWLGVVRAAHVRDALASKMERHNLIETRIREMIEEGTLLVDVTGERVGQVNGLSVLEIGGYSFGKPVRITASAARLMDFAGWMVCFFTRQF